MQLTKLLPRAAALGAAMAAIAAPALADPCGMVPPQGIPGPLVNTLTRTGTQYTYVFYKDGVQDVVLRPAFKGKVSEFGMLIPFKTPPAIRKVSDDVFGQLEAAVKPPSVSVALSSGWGMGGPTAPGSPTSPGTSPTTPSAPTGPRGPGLAYNAVNVVNQEAMGMYQVAVLEAGSPEALEKWMTTHGYVYPKGMGGVVNEYVMHRWCFVAVKARVGQKAGVSPRPGMRNASAALPPGAEFSGAVQAMGFRFMTDTPVVPMRLSAHNPGKLQNRCFILAERGVRFEQLDRAFVEQQLDGRTLTANALGALPASITYWDAQGRQITVKVGSAEEPDSLPGHLWQQYSQWASVARDPDPQIGVARDLFLSDMLSAATGRLLHHFEERHKQLLNMGDALGLRGPHMDRLLEKQLADVRREALAGMIERLERMTLTVIDGEFPRATLRDNDLTLLCYDPATGREQPLARHSGRVATPHADGEAADPGGAAHRAPLKVLWSRRESLDRRGLALRRIAERGRAEDWDRLARLLVDAREPDLVRMWTLGTMSRLRPQHTATMLIHGSVGWLNAQPAWNWTTWQARRSNPELVQAVAGHLRIDIGRRAPERLITPMLRSPHVQVRQAAAGLLPDQPSTRAAVIAALAFDAARARTSGLPWKGGALFLPGGKWSAAETALAIRELIHWQIYLEYRSDTRGRRAERRIVRNNIVALNQRHATLAGSGGDGTGVQAALHWARRQGEAHPLAAGELLVHALSHGGPWRRQVVRELQRISGKKLSSSTADWRAWLYERREEEK
jgi:hypothetical protein